MSRKKPTRAKLKAKAVTLAKDIAKERDGWKCMKCGKRKSDGWQIHGAHIVPVSFDATAADPENIIALCAACHSMGKYSAHDNPTDFSAWLEFFYPGRAEKMRMIAYEYDKNPFPKIDWEEKIKELQMKKRPQ